jgi:hypothetical protein
LNTASRKYVPWSIEGDVEGRFRNPRW